MTPEQLSARTTAHIDQLIAGIDHGSSEAIDSAREICVGMAQQGGPNVLRVMLAALQGTHDEMERRANDGR